MRVEPYSVGSIVHVIKRGARGMEIVRSDTDRKRFTNSLYILNDEYQDTRWSRITNVSFGFERPKEWPEQDPLTSVLAWTLMPNHFHLLLYEIKDGGISRFLQRICGSMSMHFNKKYQEQGSIFQGAYKSRTVDTDAYLNYLFSYIVIKNVFELYPGGLQEAIKEFDRAWRWAEQYPFSSFKDLIAGNESQIINVAKIQELDLPGKNFKKNAHDMLTAHIETRKEFEPLLLEDW